MKEKERWIRVATTFSLAICVVAIAVLLRAYLNGKFNSVQTLQQYISGYGFFAPLALTVVQAMQVVVPVLPGFLGCAVGAILFGWFGGFWCNYIGISVGSIIAFVLAKKYGYNLVKDLFPKGKYEKWSNKAAKSKSFVAFLLFIMVMPLFPDDFFCYFAGLTDMKLRRFVWIVLLGKPWCILAYSIGFSFVK